MSKAVSRPDDDGRFITLWEIFAEIGMAETAYLDEAARYLVSCLDSDPAGINYIRCRDESGVILPLDMSARLHLLQQISIFSRQGTLFDAADRPTDAAQPTFERAGFYASDIYPFLAHHDVAVSRPNKNGVVARVFSDGRRIADWILAYETRGWISRGRVTKILVAGQSDVELSPPQHDAAYYRWDAALSDAIERGTIGMTTASGRQMLAHADICAWCIQHGYVWPFEAADDVYPVASFLDTTQAEGPEAAKITKNSLKTRSNPLRAVIDMAKSLSLDKNDYHSVWAALVKLAQDTNRPAPLLGYVDDEGVKWDKNGTTEFLTKKALTSRLSRAKPR